MGRDVYRFEGVRALFKGLGPTLSGVVPARYPFQLRDFFFLKKDPFLTNRIPGPSIYIRTPTPDVS